ncbi:MAG: phospholipid carrier-dependent glycosyltransferase, partial [Bacteroidetes bacterium]
YIVIARLVTMLFDVGTIIVVYEFASSLFSKKEGLIATILVAVNPLMIQHGHTINVDTPLVFFTVLSLLLCYKILLNPSLKLSLWTGAVIGLAASSKYTGAFLLPIGILGLMLSQTNFKNVLGTWYLVLCGSLVGAFVISFFLVNPYVLLDSNEFLKDFSFEQKHMETGHLGVDTNTNGFVFYVLKVIPDYLGWLFLAALLCSLVFLVMQKKRSNWLLMSFPFLYVVMISMWNMRVERYILPAIPIFILIVSLGLGQFVSWFEKRFTHKETHSTLSFSTYRSLLTFILAFIIAGVSFQKTFSYQVSASLPNTRTLASQWLSEHLPANAIVATGPFGIKIPKERYKEFQIRFTPTESEHLFMFYQSKWYEDFDILIASDYDYGRYREDPVRYKDNLQFYDSLRTEWSLIHEIKPFTAQHGPTFWFYAYKKERAETFSNELFRKLSALADTNELISFSEELARLLYFKGKLHKSAQLMRFAVAYDSLNTRLYRELIWTLFNLKNFEEVLAYTERTLQINPNQSEIIYIKGSSLLRLGIVNEAEQNLLQALKGNNKLEMAYLDLDLLYGALGQKNKQLDVLHQYLSVFPENAQFAPMVRKRIQQLQSLQ